MTGTARAASFPACRQSSGTAVPALRGRRGRGRRWRDRGASAALWMCVVLALVPLAQMGYLVVAGALTALRPALFMLDTQGLAGGLRNAIAGSVMLVALAAVMAVPVGVAGGLYLAERTRTRFTAAVRLSVDALAGVPSIAVGYVGYVAFVGWLGWGYSWMAGAIALAVIMLPYIMRATDNAASAVPEGLREGSLALGASEALTVWRIVLPSALPGIATGCLLATGIAVGETAPLIYTASWSSFLPSVHLFHSPVAYLTYVVWTYIEQPFASTHALAFAAALLLMVMVLLLNIAARFVVARADGSRRPAAKRSA